MSSNIALMRFGALETSVSIKAAATKTRRTRSYTKLVLYKTSSCAFVIFVASWLSKLSVDLTRPSGIQVMFETERGQDFPGHEVGEVVERSGQLIEGRHCWNDHRPSFRAQHHVPKCRQAHRRLARHDDEAPLLFQHDVRRSLDEIAR